MEKKKPRIMIAGIGGASLGTELLKCLSQTDRYEIFGCDISKFAYGHYEDKFSKTFVINSNDYVNHVKKICTIENIDVIIPGGEKPMHILNSHVKSFEEERIRIASNSPEVVNLCSDKLKLFNFLKKSGIPIPKTIEFTTPSDLDNFVYPCIVKPSTESGGSRFVFFANNKVEAISYVEYLLKNNQKVMLQEYISHEEGEYTVGVLSFPDKTVVNSIVMKRIFDSKLSISSELKKGLISSGYSQGIICNFEDVKEQAKKIALKIKSTGPINIQGRISNGVFFPFEINPRFSASTFLRTLAGFNEVDVYLQNILYGKKYAPKLIRAGYYLRSLTEKFVEYRDIKNDKMD